VLHRLQLLLASFVGAIVVLGVVALFVGPSSEEMSPMAVAGIVVAYGISAPFVPRFVERRLDCSSTDALVRSYQSRFLLRLAIAETSALLGFVGVFLSGAWWPYLLGALFSMVGFARAAPTEASLTRDQEALSAAGCWLPLREALAG
jgi:hypothetical protein